MLIPEFLAFPLNPVNCQHRHGDLADIRKTAATEATVTKQQLHISLYKQNPNKLHMHQ